MFKRRLGTGSWAFATVFIFAAPARADMNYFAQGIDYWHAPPEVKPVVEHPEARKGVVEKSPRFDWQRYLDPKNDEFFREGDYTPPAPFMEVARNPSDENLRNWFTYVATKNALAARLGERMEAFAKPPKGSGLAPTVNRTDRQQFNAAVDPQRYLVRFYFDSQCPHCRRMAHEIDKLRRLGFTIEARQVDQEPPAARPPLSVPVQYVAADELRRLGIQSVPMLLIADREGGEVYRVPGYQSAEAVMSALPRRRGE